MIIKFYKGEPNNYVIRYRSGKTVTQVSQVFGVVTHYQPLKITSQMPENGVIFSDGIEEDALAFNAGAMATITLAKHKAHLLV